MFFLNNLHFNNKIKRVRRVQCPTNLTKVTGLKRDTKTLPDITNPKDNNKGWEEYTCMYIPPSQGNHAQMNKVSFTKTTMEDCCKSTCQNSDNVANYPLGKLDPEYNVIYTCGQEGIPFINNKQEDDEIAKI